MFKKNMKISLCAFLMLKRKNFFFKYIVIRATLSRYSIIFFLVSVLEDEIVPVHGKLDGLGLVRDDPVNADPNGQEDVLDPHEEENPVAGRVIGEKGLKIEKNQLIYTLVKPTNFVQMNPQMSNGWL